jgi:hypothetical protein
VSVRCCSPATGNARATASSTRPMASRGLNYLCAGYKLFFNHVDHPMGFMAELLRRGRYADEVMGILAQEELHRLKQAMANH